MTEPKDLDYMHPQGKPPADEPADDDAKPDQKHMDKALEEADGHSIYKADPFLDGLDSDPSRWEPPKE